MGNDHQGGAPPHVPPAGTPAEPPTYIPYEGAKGWGVAAFILILAGLCAFGAWTIHKNTYKSPRDPTYINMAPSSAPATE